MRRKDPATGRAYGPRVPRDLPDTSHGICRHCARLTWDAWRASEPDRHIPTYATMRRHAARQRRLEELH